jgi:hypothetical protein
MNIFYLSKDPRKCARYHVDKHVVKMIVETAQLLSTALVKNGYRSIQSPDTPIYKPTHPNHPSNIWARASQANFEWLHDLGIELCKEYEFRYKREHKTKATLGNILFVYTVLEAKKSFSTDSFTPPPAVMPNEFIIEGRSIASYRNYYSNDKFRLLRYSGRNFKFPGGMLGNYPPFVDKYHRPEPGAWLPNK